MQLCCDVAGLRSARSPTRCLVPGQVLVRTLACAVCASDLHYMDHPEAGADDDSGWSTYDQDVDIVMGHEYCAEIVDYGPGSERPVPIGTRVSSRPLMFALGGMKIIGQTPETPGGFGELMLLDETLLKVVPSDLPSEVVCVSDAEHWSEAFEAVCTGALDVTPMLGRTVGLDQVPEALDAARDANSPAHIVVVP